MMTVALLGAGRMGQIHLANLEVMPLIELRYIFDPAINPASFAHRSSARFVDRIEDILTDREVDACIIATPSTLHATLITACANAGKHVFCEKPVSFNVEVLMAVKHDVEKARINLQIGFNRRFDPSIAKLQQEVARNKLGAIYLLKLVSRDPLRPRIDFVKDSGGLFFDFNVHDFDMLRFITGDKIDEIYVAGDALIDRNLVHYHDIDTAIISAKMKSGALAIIDSSRETGYGYDQQIEILGARGALHVKNQSPTTVSVRNAKGLHSEAIYQNFQERYRESYRLELEAFFASLNQSICSPNIDDAIAAVKIAKAAAMSLQENRPIVVPE